MNEIELYAFKVKDYTTILFGQKETESMPIYRSVSEVVYYYVQRGDGRKHRYHENQIEWVKRIGVFNLSDRGFRL